MLCLGQALFQHRQLLFRQLAHVGIGEQRLGFGHVFQELAPGGDLVDHRLEIGIFLGQRRDLAGIGAGVHPGLQINGLRSGAGGLRESCGEASAGQNCQVWEFRDKLLSW